jgi:hypothetical protein
VREDYAMRDLPSRLGRLEHQLAGDDMIGSGEEFRTFLSRLPTGVVRRVYLDYIAGKGRPGGIVAALRAAAGVCRAVARPWHASPIRRR